MKHPDFPQELSERLSYIAVFGLTTGTPRYCQCPQGHTRTSKREAETVTEGTCKHPGKHPWFTGFPNGVKDAMPYEEWQAPVPASILPPSATLRDWVIQQGTRLAAAIPSDVWVLDYDNHNAKRELIAIGAYEAIQPEQVLAYDTSPRGGHLWIQAAHTGWRTGTAQEKLTKAGLKALEVKSAGSYVVIPDADNPFTETERTWQPVANYWTQVERYRALHMGWGSLDAAGKGPGSTLSGVRFAQGWPPVSRPRSPIQPPRYATSEDGLMQTAADLKAYAAQLAALPTGSRNNELNKTAFLVACP